jgi:hypothetical protein
VYTYLKELVTGKPNKKAGEVLAKTQECAAEACDVSRRTVQRICNEAERSMVHVNEVGKPVSSNSSKKVPHVKRVTGSDDFEKDLLRRTIQEFFDRGSTLLGKN